MRVDLKDKITVTDVKRVLKDFCVTLSHEEIEAMKTMSPFALERFQRQKIKERLKWL